MQDESHYEKVLRIENKDVFVDLKSNQNGSYLKISERKNGNRNSILIPATGVMLLIETLQDLASGADLESTSMQTQSGSRRQDTEEDVERKTRSCYVGNLSWECDEDQLSAWCAGAGAINSSVILRRGKRSMGSGLVEFADVASAQNAVATLNDTEMDGRVILVREDRPTQEIPTSGAAVKQTTKSAAKEKKAKFSDMDRSEKVVEPNKVFVQNLTWETTEEELVAAFCPVADVTSVEIRQTRSGRSLGCGVVEFNSAQGALDAISSLNGEDLNGREMLIREYYQ